MLDQSEFETHTDIFPDVLMYDAAEREYSDGEWESKAQFCHAFKFNEDGLAQKCQRIANERWIILNDELNRLRSEIRPLADKCEQLMCENNRLEEINDNLTAEMLHLSERVDDLSKQVDEIPEMKLEETSPSIREAMQMAVMDAAHDDCKGDEVLHMLWGFDYLLQRLGVE